MQSSISKCAVQMIYNSIARTSYILASNSLPPTVTLSFTPYNQVYDKIPGKLTSHSRLHAATDVQWFYIGQPPTMLASMTPGLQL